MAAIPSTDSITASVIRSAMETVCFEMATYVSRTATTPILNQSNERNATILDQHGRLAALSVGIPQFMLSSTLPVRLAIEFFEDDLRSGRRDRGERPLPRRRPPAGLQRVQPGVRRRRGAGAVRLHPVPPRRHRRRDGRGVQRLRQGHLERGHPLPDPQDHRRRHGAAGRRPDDAGQQPVGRLRRRSPLPGGRGPARGRAAARRSSTTTAPTWCARPWTGRSPMPAGASPRRSPPGPTGPTRPTSTSMPTRQGTATSTSMWRSPSPGTG